MQGDDTIEAVAKLAASRIEAAGNPKRAAKKLAAWRNIPGWIVVTSQTSPGDPFVEKVCDVFLGRRIDTF